ncbi:helix-turn-helix domain-containing protein [Stieleria sp. JC731]|uniref:helix-turn-helix domain-containing protein n=1 Tax=Pirellulaceae TaxID=2691357 RepID=UPI001E39A22F|nr:helix-turn-helix domain-containing protein [Stieleria sp. JC731]MCC9603537.1 helix-turn-helix domain-containing protein [Stieleria sp. JC731]
MDSTHNDCLSPNALYTQSQVADLLCVDEKHVRRLRNSGDLVAVDISLRTSSKPMIRYKSESIKRFIELRSMQSEAPKPKKKRRDIPRNFEALLNGTAR